MDEVYNVNSFEYILKANSNDGYAIPFVRMSMADTLRLL